MLGRAQLNGTREPRRDQAGRGSRADVHDADGRADGPGELPVAPPCTAATCRAPSANTWVRAYTNVSYGRTRAGPPPRRPATRPCASPSRSSALPTHLVGTTSYSSEASQTTYDIAYDMWLNPSGTQRPCRTQGTVEVMLWTDYDRQALLPSPPVASSSIPYAVGGVAHDGPMPGRPMSSTSTGPEGPHRTEGPSSSC